jgi:hypothetical protein
MSRQSAHPPRREGFRAGRFNQTHRASPGASSTKCGSRPLSHTDLIWCLTGRAVATTPFIEAWWSRNSNLVRTGKLDTVRVAGRALIRRDELDRLIAEASTSACAD